jgi:hypothetical protein
MKNCISLLFIFLFSVLGCSTTSNPIESTDDRALKIKGVITNHMDNFTKVYASYSPNTNPSQNIESEITADGSFELEIPEPDVSFLSDYIPQNKVFIMNGDSIISVDSIKINAGNLKYLRYSISAVSTPAISYTLPLNSAKISTIGEPPEIDNFIVSYYYFNTKTKIHGYYKWKFTTGDSCKEIITNFDINTKSGWNRILTRFEFSSSDKEIYTVKDIDEKSGDWIIGASDYFSKALYKF